MIFNDFEILINVLIFERASFRFQTRLAKNRKCDFDLLIVIVNCSYH